MQEAEDLTT
jgi:hypothetical protein